MAHYITPNEWKPADGFELEDNALDTIISDNNRLIVAGPGAGKTELLAQRACYLLQTNICPSPKKILAISFKRDAAFNLAARVEKRVGKSLSRRFTSLTFDAFSKGLVDRFRNGLPDSYQPNAAYRIDTNPFPDTLIALFEKYSPGITQHQASKVRNEKKRNCIRLLTGDSYPLHSSEELALSVLNGMFKTEGQELVTFPVLSRLAQLLLYSNPKITRYLRQTYSHIFLDEFQDTTRLQYDLLKTAFLNSDNVLTAVGDTKQRIMLWAGAMDGIFESFLSDFSAFDFPLLMNFRSAPRLVRLQNHLAKELMGSDIECIPRKDRDSEEGIAEFWFFDDYQQESNEIALAIHKMINEEGIEPREICLIYKQRPDHYAIELQKELEVVGIHARVENEIQDLLVEPVIQFLINFVKSSLSSTTDSNKERNLLLQEYSKFKKIYDDDGYLKLERDTISKLKAFNKRISKIRGWDEVEDLIKAEIESVSFSIFSSNYPQYNEKTFFDECIARFFTTIQKYFQESSDLLHAVQKFTGKDCVPIMTIHKSKGLEFSVVFFIGFEDQNFWTYHEHPEEDTCSFFVALSRAKEAVYFTFSRGRVNNFGNYEIRSIQSINPMFKGLQTSNLVEGKDFMEPAPT